MKKEPKVKKHDDRPDLTGEHPWGDVGQLICLAIFILVWIVDIFVFKISEQDYLFIPKGLLIFFGSIILILGLYLAKKSARIIFGKQRENPELIHEKVYDFIRHPMYLGALLFYLGIALAMYSAPLFILFLLIFLFYNFIAKHEEKLLTNKFGNDYQLYKQNVGRWVPRLFNRSN